MIVKIDKGVAKGTITAPASKSMAHRLLICASLSEGQSIVKGISDCVDVSATLSCIDALGIGATVDGNVVTVRGSDIKKSSPKRTLDAKESGSTLRFLIPVALATGKTVMFTGANRLMQRPMDVYEKLCKEKGLIYLTDGQTITVKGPIKSGEYFVVGNVSSQFISGLLFALPLLDKDSRIKIAPPIESRSYIEMTRLAQQMFGVVSVWEDDHTLFIPGGQKYIYLPFFFKFLIITSLILGASAILFLAASNN